jgi:hypothetical protein
LAGLRERIGPRRDGSRHRRSGPLAFRGIGFAPETIARAAICRAFVLFPETMMIAYLIALALAALVALAVSDALF